MSKYKVAVLLPTCAGFTEETLIAVSSMAMYSMNRGVEIDLLNQSVTGVAKCRNSLVEEALKRDYTHVLFVDSDTWFPMNTLERLLARDKDIVGVPYTVRAFPVFMLGAPLHEADALATTGLIEAYSMGSGLMLIRTDVFKSVPKPWYYEAYTYEGKPATQFAQCVQDALADKLPGKVMQAMLALPELKAWLEQPDHGRHGLTCERSEDTNFVFKARRYGYSTWSDLDIAPQVLHIGKYAYGIKDLPK